MVRTQGQTGVLKLVVRFRNGVAANKHLELYRVCARAFVNLSLRSHIFHRHEIKLRGQEKYPVTLTPEHRMSDERMGLQLPHLRLPLGFVSSPVSSRPATLSGYQ